MTSALFSFAGRFFCPASLILAASPLHAQIVNNGATNTLSNIANSFTAPGTPQRYFRIRIP
jgi:hypothetical protein